MIKLRWQCLLRDSVLEILETEPACWLRALTTETAEE